MPSYREHSEGWWTKTANPDDYPGDVPLVIGCLQRIADALEKIANRLDPEWRLEDAQRRAKRKEMERDNAVLDEWQKALRPLWQSIRTAIWWIAKHHPESAKRPVIRNLASHVYWRHRDELRDCSRSPTEEDAPAIAEVARSFDPLTYDWSAVKMTALCRQRLNVALENARKKTPAEGMVGDE
jgi:hypothetical protein